jgi:hypothetical protein
LLARTRPPPMPPPDFGGVPEGVHLSTPSRPRASPRARPPVSRGGYSRYTLSWTDRTIIVHVTRDSARAARSTESQAARLEFECVPAVTKSYCLLCGIRIADAVWATFVLHRTPSAVTNSSSTLGFQWFAVARRLRTTPSN